MEPLSLEAIAGAMRADLVVLRGTPVVDTAGNWPLFVSAVCTDTRKLVPGCVFFALKGPNFDGHRFVREAFEKGAIAAVIERAQYQAIHSSLRSPLEGAPSLHPSATLLVVENTLSALGDVARWYRSRFGVLVVGVTGSVGKTSTKEMLASILRQRGAIVATAGNLNNEIGLPLTLLGLASDHFAAVVELAMRGAGQIRALAEIAQPHVGVITNIGTAHLELLGSQEAIARAKGELLEVLPAAGAAILPAAEQYLPLLRSLSRAPVTTFGFADATEADVSVTHLEIGPQESHFILAAEGEQIPVRLPLPGRHNALNAAAAAAAALRAGATPQEIAAGLSTVSLPGMRMEVVTTPWDTTVLNDAYNASPASMAAALDHLRRLPGKRRVAILGDMLELGADSEKSHRETGAAAAWVDLLIAVGPRARALAAGAIEAGLPAGRTHHCADASDAVLLSRALVQPGDAVLVKASRAMQLERVVEALTEAPRKTSGDAGTAPLERVGQ